MRYKLLITCILLFAGLYLKAQYIVAYEYFFDTDPGVGNGVGITVTASETQDLNLQFPTTGLESGFHSLFIRFKDINGKWSLYEGRRFYLKAQAPVVTTPQIIKGEYFFDTDPGVSKGLSIDVVQGDTLNFLKNISTTGLSPGFHSLFIRFKNENGKWSLYEGRRFYIKDQTAVVTTPQIIKGEYFFDTDPGVGKGVSVDVVQGDKLNFLKNISTTGLSSGFHSLFIRFKNENGKWSLYEGRRFYIKPKSQASQSSSIVAVEYFIGNDPGIGSGTTINAMGGEKFDITFNVSTNSLAKGKYIFTVRVRDSLGNWSLNEAREFAISTKYTINASIQPNNSGTISGSGDYFEGDTASLTATPKIGYNFVNWTENATEVSTDTIYSFTISENRTLVANFELQNIDITASVSPENSGTITGTGNYNNGDTADLIATPKTGYTFVNWTEDGTEVSANKTYSFTVSEDRTLVANFTNATGISDIETISSFKIHPNPTNDILSIKFNDRLVKNQSNVRLILIDNSGRKIGLKITSFSETEIQTNVSNIKQGVYYLQAIVNNKKTETVKVIITD